MPARITQMLGTFPATEVMTVSGGPSNSQPRSNVRLPSVREVMARICNSATPVGNFKGQLSTARCAGVHSTRGWADFCLPRNGLPLGGPVCWLVPSIQWGNANGLLRYPGSADRVRHDSGDRCCALRLSDVRLARRENAQSTSAGRGTAKPPGAVRTADAAGWPSLIGGCCPAD